MLRLIFVVCCMTPLFLSVTYAQEAVNHPSNLDRFRRLHSQACTPEQQNICNNQQNACSARCSANNEGEPVLRSAACFGKAVTLPTVRYEEL